MLKWFNKKKKDNKGFTLVELIIVVAILAILVGLLAPQYTKYVEKSRKAADASNLEELVKAFKVAASDPDYVIQEGEYRIVIRTTGTTVSFVETAGTQSGTDKNDWKKALKDLTEYSFDGSENKELKLKSSRWVADGLTNVTTAKAHEIGASIKVEQDGQLVVTYDPKTLKEGINTPAGA